MPARSIHPDGQAIGHVGIVHPVHQRGIDAVELAVIEPGRGAAEGREVERLDKAIPFRDRFDRQGCSETSKQGDQRIRFDPAFAKSVASERSQPLRQLALAPHQQGLVREIRHHGSTFMLRSNKCGKHLNLNGSIGYVILSAQDVGHAHFEIVHRAWQHIEPGPVGAADHRIGELRGVEFLFPAHPVFPHDRRVVVELEAPVRCDPFGFLRCTILLAQCQGAAVVDRRQSAPELDLALQFEFLRRLVAGIDPRRFPQAFERRLVMRQPLGLALFAIGTKAQPGQIVPDRLHIFLAAAVRVGIVDPQQEPPARLARQHPVMQRGADIADMEAPGRGRGEAGHGHRSGGWRVGHRGLR